MGAQQLKAQQFAPTDEGVTVGDSSILTIGAKGAGGGSTAAEGATICAEGADEGVSVGDSSIITIGAKQLKVQQI